METVPISEVMTRDVITVAPTALLSEVIAIMRQQRISLMVIAEQHRPLGIITERDLVSLALRRQNPEKTAVSLVMTSPVVTVPKSMDLFTAYDRLVSHHIRHLVVADEAGLIAGVVTLTNILGGMNIEYFIELKQVSHVMARNIITLAPGDTLFQAMTLMVEKRISCIVIVEGAKPVGIVTERDITRMYGDGIAEQTRLHEVMTTPIRTLSDDTFIPEANAVMRGSGIRHLVVVDDAGALVGLISQTDIARRLEGHYVEFLRSLVAQQHEKIRDERERFATLFGKNPNAVISYDSDGHLLDMNHAGVALTGYAADELKGSALRKLVYADDAQVAELCFRKARAGDSGHAEFRIVSKSGEIRHVFNSCLPIFVDGALRHVYCIFHDITEHKEAEQRIRQAEERAMLLAHAVEQAGDSVMITDRSGTLQFVNRAFTTITGYSEEEALGRTPGILKSGEQDDAFYRDMWATISSGKPWTSRLVDRRKDGSFFPAELSISPVKKKDGEISHFIGIKRDLSERESLEARFYQAQKMEALGTLVGGVAHDFNNMLAGICSNLYLARRKVGSPEDVSRHLAEIDEIAARATGMIKQLLTFARKDKIHFSAIAFPSFVEETVGFLRGLVPNNVQVRLRVSHERMEVNGDKSLLHQVLMNLVSNAVDALDGVSDAQLTVRVESYLPDAAFRSRHKVGAEAMVRLVVEDNGCGIDPDDMDHLFDPFFTTKEQGKGTGLGLSMVFGAVESHGGVIEVESTRGSGASFSVYLPRVDGSVRETNRIGEMKEAGRAGRQEKEAGAPITLLLADDEPKVREATAEVLEDLGYRVLQAEDGPEAVEVFRKYGKEIRVALLDVVMPHFGGVQLATRLREINPDIPVIFVTGFDKEHLLGRDGSFPNSEILSKPVWFDTLDSAIGEILGRSGGDA